MKNSTLLSFLLAFLPQKYLSRDKFIQDAASYFANGNDSILIAEPVLFMTQT